VSLFADLRVAVRSLAKQPRFSAIAVLTLALGVGAVTAIFSVVNGVLLTPLPFPAADRLVNVWSHAPKLGYDQFPLSPDLYFVYERGNQVFESMALFQRRRANLTSEGTPDVVDTLAATRTYFDTLGAPLTRGRSFTVEEDAPDAPRVVVISHRAWVDRFGRDERIIGRVIRLDGDPTDVIGVAAVALDTRGSPDFFLPSRLNRESPPQGTFGWNAIARLKPGVRADDTVPHLMALLATHMEGLQSPLYRAFVTDGGYQPRVNLMHEDLIGALERPLWILLGTVGMLLIIACANVANLFLVRAEGRQREMAVRAALGAGRSRLVRQVMAEALVLAMAGSALGLAASALGVPALLRLAPPAIPRLDQVGLDPIVVLFAIGAAVVSSLLFGLWPALRYSRGQALSALRHGGRGGTDEPARRRARNALVVAQTAMALVLLVGSGLLIRSFGRLASTDLGFEPRDVMTFRVSLPPADYQDSAAVASFTDRLVTRLTEVAGVTSAGAVSELPVATAAPGMAHTFEGQPLAPNQLPPMVHFKTVHADYFGAMQMPLRSGRTFHSGDLAPGRLVAIVNDALAEKYWPGADPVGKRIRRAASGADTPPPWITVVGVVGTERQDGLRLPVRPLVYYPVHDDLPGGVPRVMNYVVRGPGIAARADALREAVWSVDRALPVASLQSMTEIVDASIVPFTFTMLTLGIAAGMALLLGAIGLYGVLSYAVTLRTREIGVRLALGAPPSRVMRAVVAQGAAIAAVGLVIGLACAAGLTRFLGNILFETPALDPGTFVVMSLALFVVAMLASYLPARRAASVSPLESIKTD
jgi:predicted permease